MAEKAHLYGRSAGAEQTWATFAAEAHEIHGDVDLELAHHSGRLGIASCTYVDELRECGPDAPSERALVRRTQGDRQSLEALAVMVLEHSRHEVGHGMFTEVARYVRDTYPLSGATGNGKQVRSPLLRMLVCGVGACALQLFLRRIRDGKKDAG